MQDLGDPSILAFPSEAEAIKWLLTKVLTLEGRIIGLEKENANLAATRDRMAALAARVSGLEAAQDELDSKVRGARKPGEKQTARIAKLEQILVARKNQPMTFSEIGKILELGSRVNGKSTRRQAMTKFAKSLDPEKFEIFPSKMGGKIIRLSRKHCNRLHVTG